MGSGGVLIVLILFFYERLANALFNALSAWNHRWRVVS